MSPLPFGLKQGGYYNVNTATEYRKSFLKNLTPNRTNLIYLSYIDTSTNIESRNQVPTVKKRVPFSEYLDGMAHSKYVLSPNGMKPECYRHYEAIGLGTVPVTELSVDYSWHLKGSIVYNNSNWEMEYLEKTLPNFNISPNRNMIFEEYWIEYMDHESRHGPLNWWDRHTLRRSTLGNFVLNVSLDEIIKRESNAKKESDESDDEDDDSESSE